MEGKHWRIFFRNGCVAKYVNEYAHNLLNCIEFALMDDLQQFHPRSARHYIKMIWRRSRTLWGHSAIKLTKRVDIIIDGGAFPRFHMSVRINGCCGLRYGGGR